VDSVDSGGRWTARWTGRLVDCGGLGGLQIEARGQSTGWTAVDWVDSSQKRTLKTSGLKLRRIACRVLKSFFRRSSRIRWPAPSSWHGTRARTRLHPHCARVADSSEWAVLASDYSSPPGRCRRQRRKSSPRRRLASLSQILHHSSTTRCSWSSNVSAHGAAGDSAAFSQRSVAPRKPQLVAPSPASPASCAADS
jgi:hypothetical protein